MVKKVRARYSEGSLTPLAPLDLSEGEVVTLTVEVDSQVSKEERRKKSMATAGAWADNSEYWENFKEYLYEARSRGLSDEEKP